MKTLVVNRSILVLILATALIGFGIQSSYGQTITASVPQTLTEENLHGSVVTLTLTGGTYESSRFRIERAVTFSGIEGITVATFGLDRVSDTVVTVELEFDGNIDADGTLTFTVGADAIANYTGSALTATAAVTALEESLAASAESPLTEANLHGSIVTLTLTGRQFADEWEIGNAVSVSGIDGVTFESWRLDRVSDTEVTVDLTFDGDFDTDATLTFTVEADAIVGYNQGLTAEVSVTALEESLAASTEFSLTEATLDGSIVTLMLSGRNYEEYSFQVEEALTVSGIDGVTVEEYIGVERVTDTEVKVKLTFNGDFDTDATLTFAVGADAIAGYNQGFAAEIPVTAIEKSNATVSISPASVVSPDVGEELIFSINIAGGENVAGYQVTVSLDSTTLQPIVLFDSEARNASDVNVFHVSFTNGDYLPAGAFFADPIVVDDWIGDTFLGEPIWSTKVILAANTLAEAANGDGTLATLTFKIGDFKPSTLTLSQVYLVDSDGKRWEATTENGEVTIPDEPEEPISGDINRDGVVDILDLTIVAARFGQRGQNSADISGDGLVDIVDLVLVAAAFTDEAAAPSVYPQASELLTAADVRQWLTQAQELHLTDPNFERGIDFLEQLLTVLTPTETTLLPNYPNPFNPETWIPYRLAEDAFVTLTIYDQTGQVVRTLDVGHRIAAVYENRSKAIYWDGRNESGEQVASGVYFYHLSAGRSGLSVPHRSDFSATRKMLILK